MAWFQIETPPSEEHPPLIRYLGAQFRRVSNGLDLAIETILRVTLAAYVAKGYGGISLAAANVFPDFQLAYQKINIFDQANVTEPFDVTQNVANSSLELARAGIWQFTFMWAFNHNELNAGRFYTMQFYNETDATVLAEFIFGTGRNVDISQGTIAFIGEIPISAEGDSLIWRIGDASAYSAVVFRTLSYNVNHISELKVA